MVIMTRQFFGNPRTPLLLLWDREGEVLGVLQTLLESPNAQCAHVYSEYI